MLLPLSFLALVSAVAANANGAPDTVAACNTMHPSHGNNKAQDAGHAPYTLTLATNHYGPGQFIAGKLIPDPGSHFKGFMIKAQTVGGSDVGHFSDGDLSKVKTICDRRALTHTIADEKTEAINFVWQAPYGDFGPIHFSYTVVWSYDFFWVKEAGPVLSYSNTVG